MDSELSSSPPSGALTSATPVALISADVGQRGVEFRRSYTPPPNVPFVSYHVAETFHLGRSDRGLR